MIRGGRQRTEGAALALVAIILLAIVPLVLLLGAMTMRMTKVSSRERVNESARRQTDNIVFDYMTELSKGDGYQQNHFSPDLLDRTKTFFETGFASVRVSSSIAERTIRIQALGGYGAENPHAKSQRGLSVLIKFVPLVGTQAYYCWQKNNGTLDEPWAVPNTVFNGPLRHDGNLDVSAGDCRFRGPVVVGKNLTAVGSTDFESDVYVGGTASGGIYAKTPVVGKIPSPKITLSRDYYEMISTTASLQGRTVWWDFGMADPAGTGIPVACYRSCWDTSNDRKILGPEISFGSWVPIPLGGGVFYADNAKTYVSGTVGARVTIVCTSLTGLAGGNWDDGVIEVVGPIFGYVGGAVQANANASIFAMATRGFRFSLPPTAPANTTLRVYGTYYLASPEITTPCSGGNEPSRICRVDVNGNCVDSNDNFSFVGSWNRLGGCISQNWVWNSTFDPNLQYFPGPGVPEMPVLIGWQRTRE